MGVLVECPQKAVTSLIVQAEDEHGLSYFGSWHDCEVVLGYAEDGATMKVFVKSKKT